MSPQETARVFVLAILDDGDLETAWGVADVELRRELANAWVTANESHPSIRARSREVIMTALVDGAADHPLWPHFAVSAIEEFRDAWSKVDTATWGWATGPRPVTIDTEVVLFVDRTGVPDGPLPHDMLAQALALLMRYDGSRWWVAALPAPGDGR
jgi:hypothetical protein